MICEFAITPHVFDDEANADDPLWLEHLRELGRSLFPRTRIHPIVISNLYDGSWEHELSNTVNAIEDYSAKLLAQGLLKQMKDAHLCVDRPPAGDWPDSETGWAAEAMLSSAVSCDSPISRVLVTDRTCVAVAGAAAGWTPLSAVQTDACWSDVQPFRSVELSFAAQIGALRTVICHASFIAVVSPHVYGGIDDETEFIARLINAAQSRPFGSDALLIDVHTEAPDRPGTADFPTRLANRIADVESSLRPLITTARVRIFTWPKLLDRYILAGSADGHATNPAPERFRWAIAPQHVVRPREPVGAPPTFWALVPSDQVNSIADRFYAKVPLSGPHVI